MKKSAYVRRTPRCLASASSVGMCFWGIVPPVPPFSREYCHRYGAVIAVPRNAATAVSPPSFLMIVRAGSMRGMF